MKDDEEFKKALADKQVPILVLDEKWHRLFAVHGTRLSRMGLALSALRQIPGAPHPGTGLIMEVPPLEWKTVQYRNRG